MPCMPCQAMLYTMLCYMLCYMLYSMLCFAMPCHLSFANTKIYRMKFGQWGKTFARMEEVVVEFELKTDEKPEFQTFLTEMQGKFESMVSFKKRGILASQIDCCTRVSCV